MNKPTVPAAPSHAAALVRQLQALWEQGQTPDADALLRAAGVLAPAEVAEVLAADQWQRWHAGQRVAVEDYLARHPALADPTALLALAYGEFLLRKELGEQPAAAEFLARFPHCADGLRRQLEFHGALTGPGGESDALDLAGTVGGPITERPGALIGPYKLMEKIGEGGMGLVFVALQQQPLRRKVALKVIKPGMDTRQVIARFEAERQALALMDHPNIAKVLDGGATTSGLPYFVMELVKGVPITDYCDQNHVGVRERLELFTHVCRAVQHAHQKGIIHRDLKPSNVLVLSQDGTPLVKVIDFGVAKAIGQPLTDKTIYTQWTQLVGTPLYMSPEQAGQSGVDVDTRTDIYALGVLLYELLTGTTPFDRERLRQAGHDEMRRIIREEEPARPSTRISKLGQAATTVSSNRQSDPRQLSRLFRGELDWVVMKCLEKDRNRRYETANGLARDVQRYLHDEPVEAGPPSAGYRLRKLARKYRAALGIAGLFVALLALGGAASAWQAVRATRAERQAVAERDRAEQERERAQAGFRMARDTVDRFFTQVADSPRLKGRGMEKFRKDLLQNAKDFYERFIRAELDAPRVRHDLGLAHQRLAKIEAVLGDFAAAQALSEKAIEILGELAQAHPEVVEYRRDLAASQYRLGAICYDADLPDRAEAAYRQALAVQEGLAADYPEVAEYRRALATTQGSRGILHGRSGRLQKAQESLEQALALWSRLVADDPRAPEDRHGLAGAQWGLGQAYKHRGWSDKAEAMLQQAEGNYEALAKDYPEVPEYRQSLARTYGTLGGLYHDNLAQADKAEAAHQRALRIFEGLAREHPDVVEFDYRLGQCYYGLALDADLAGRADAALARYDKAIEILHRAIGRGYGQGRGELLDAQALRAGMLAGRGDHARAAQEASAVARQGGLAGGNLYNLGCAFARSSAAAANDGKLAHADRAKLQAQYAARAMELLRQALANGFQNAALLKGDKDLDPLRGREDFQKLVREVEREATK
jgi:serine/threonine protein kinase/tetratricopeptide (TPR) repeat protein